RGPYRQRRVAPRPASLRGGGGRGTRRLRRRRPAAPRPVGGCGGGPVLPAFVSAGGRGRGANDPCVEPAPGAQRLSLPGRSLPGWRAASRTVRLGRGGSPAVFTSCAPGADRVAARHLASPLNAGRPGGRGPRFCGLVQVRTGVAAGLG